MKAYLINSASKMKEAVELMKWQSDALKVQAFAKVWSAEERKANGKADRIYARIEVGRNVQVFKVIGTEVSLLGTMQRNAVPGFVKGLEEIK